MPKGLAESYYNFKLTCFGGETEYFRMSTEITKKYEIPKNSIYNIINKKSMRKFKEFTIEKCKLPVFKRVLIDPSKL